MFRAASSISPVESEDIILPYGEVRRANNQGVKIILRSWLPKTAWLRRSARERPMGSLPDIHGVAQAMMLVPPHASLHYAIADLVHAGLWRCLSSRRRATYASCSRAFMAVDRVGAIHAIGSESRVSCLGDCRDCKAVQRATARRAPATSMPVHSIRRAAPVGFSSIAEYAPWNCRPGCPPMGVLGVFESISAMTCVRLIERPVPRATADRSPVLTRFLVPPDHHGDLSTNILDEILSVTPFFPNPFSTRARHSRGRRSGCMDNGFRF